MIEEILSQQKFRIYVRPNAKKTRITSAEDGVLMVDVKAPPEEGRANLEVIKHLSRILKRPVAITSGMTSRRKTIKAL